MKRQHLFAQTAAIAVLILGTVLPAFSWSFEAPPEKAWLVDTYEQLFLSDPARERIVSAFEMARHYLPFVQQQVAMREMPDELAFLPVIESGFNPLATSPAGAAGIWQFMLNTVDEYDLRVSDSIDQRRDFWKSTEAGLQKLSDDFVRFGSWELALAAYNCGANRVRRAIEATGITDYWELSDTGLLPAETVAYLPKLIALRRLIEQADALGFGNWSAYDYSWVRIEVSAPVHITLLATASGVDPALLRLWNADLRVGVTPHASEFPGEPYLLKVPDVYADTINRSLLYPEVQMTDYLVHRIRPGETFSLLASRYGVSVDTIISFNPGIEPRFLQLNTGVIIPLDESPQVTAHHVVRTGETLWEIAMRYDTSVEALSASNSIIDPDRISPGLTLAVPGHAE